MAQNYRYTGTRLPIASASAAITTGTFVVQEGLFGVALTSAKSGASLWLGAEGVWVVPVVAGTVKGDRLAVAAMTDSTGASIITAATGGFFIGTAISDRDTAGNSLVTFGPQGPRVEP